MTPRVDWRECLLTALDWLTFAALGVLIFAALMCEIVLSALALATCVWTRTRG